MSIAVHSLSHRYERHGELVIDGLNFTIEAGSITGLLGPSGSGKTTLIRAMVGLLAPSQGGIVLEGSPAGGLALRQGTGYMAQSDALYADLSGVQNLRFFGSLYGLRGARLKDRIKAVLELTKLEAHAKKRVKHYSGGMKKRLSLAITLLHQPTIVFLDEPTVGIDPLLRAEFWEEFQRLKAAGCTLVVSTHVMDEAEKCDRLGLIFEGRLLQYGSPAEIKAATGCASIEQAFLSLRRHPGSPVEVQP